MYMTDCSVQGLQKEQLSCTIFGYTTWLPLFLAAIVAFLLSFLSQFPFILTLPLRFPTPKNIYSLNDGFGYDSGFDSVALYSTRDPHKITLNYTDWIIVLK